MIYVFGNSHSNFFTNSHPATPFSQTKHFTVYNLNGTIAYNFYEHHFPTVKQIIHHEQIAKDSNILICIGEVDCRLHLPQQADLQNRNIFELTEECIDRLFRCFLELKHDGYNVIGWGGHPTTTESHDMSNPSRPIYGECMLRNKISLFWSDYLQHKCNIHNMKFVSIIRDLIDSEGLTKMEYFIDYCHLNSNMLLSNVQQLLYKWL